MSGAPLQLTRTGFEELQAELERLVGEGRREVAGRLRDALVEGGGDLAENAEYLAAKEEQLRLEQRILLLEERLRTAEIVEDGDVRTDVVSLGSRVRVRDVATGQVDEFVIVGSPEADPERHRISTESPVGRELLGRSPGDRPAVDAPGGVRELEILEISQNGTARGGSRRRDGRRKR